MNIMAWSAAASSQWLAKVWLWNVKIHCVIPPLGGREKMSPLLQGDRSQCHILLNQSDYLISQCHAICYVAIEIFVIVSFHIINWYFLVSLPQIMGDTEMLYFSSVISTVVIINSWDNEKLRSRRIYANTIFAIMLLNIYKLSQANIAPLIC